MMAIMIAIQSSAQWDGTSAPWTQGSGTESNPYLIECPQHLAYLADMVCAGVNDYSGKHFLLTQDISLSNQSWMPIGDENHPYKGNFDGGGHTIDSLCIFNTTYTDAGLFGGVYNGTLKNINLSCMLNTGTRRGGIVSYMSVGKVINCNVNIIGSANVNTCSTYGGIIGWSVGTAIKNCTVHSISINGKTSAGGIVGCHGSGDAIHMLIDNCSFYGRIIASDSNSYVGGIVGFSNTMGIDTIINCHNYGVVSGHMYVGGIIGKANNIFISRCTSEDSVVSVQSTSYCPAFVGGILGATIGDDGLITLCYNHGVIKVSGTFEDIHCYYHPAYGQSPRYYSKHIPCYVSGIGNGISILHGAHSQVVSGYYSHVTVDCFLTRYPMSNCLTIYNSYNTGSIIGNITVQGLPTNYNGHISYSSNNCTYCCGIGSGLGYNSYNVGGLYSYSQVKYGTSTNSYNSYYISSCGATYGGNSRTEAQMKSISFPLVLNTDSTVFVMDQTNSNDGYPVFWFTVAYDITTDTATNITSYNAELNGHYGGVADTVGFIYGLNNNNTAMTQIIASETTSPVSLVLTGLQPNTQYRYTFFVKHNGTYIYGDTLTFTTKPTYSISLSSNNNAWGSVSGGGVYGYGDTATLTATAVNHYQFMQWSDGNTDNPRTINVTNDTSLIALFQVAQYTITVSVNNSAWGSATGAGVYDYWSPAILTAVPNVGYHYKQWSSPSGDWHYEENPFLISHVVADVEYICEFEPNQYTVTVLANDSNMGIVSGGGSYNYGQQIYIIAQPIGNYIFTQWSDGETSAYRLITVTDNITYTAIFTDAIFNITAQSNNASFGTVTGSGSYARGSQVQLTAIPNEGYHFTQWNDGNTENPRTITVNADATYTAQFAANTYVVNVSSSNSSMGSATGGGIFSYGQQITIEATPMPHYRFTQWDDGMNSNPRVVTITSDTTFTAMFEQMPQYIITVVSEDATKGSVSGGGTFYGGEQTVISATASSGNVFDRWSDGNTEAIRTITVTSDATYTAYFSGVRCTVNVYSNDDNMGTVSGGGEYEQGAQATVTATPANGCRFVRWNNGVEQNPYTFTVYSNVNLIANFERFSDIDDAVENKYSILSKGLDIIIDGAENEPVIISNVLGQRMYVSSKYNGEQLKMPITGVYFVKIGVNPAIKIVLIH